MPCRIALCGWGMGGPGSFAAASLIVRPSPHSACPTPIRHTCWPEEFQHLGHDLIRQLLWQATRHAAHALGHGPADYRVLVTQRLREEETNGPSEETEGPAEARFGASHTRARVHVNAGFIPGSGEVPQSWYTDECH